MRIKEYRTELDKDKKNVLCEIGYYDVTEDMRLFQVLCKHKKLI